MVMGSIGFGLVFRIHSFQDKNILIRHLIMSNRADL